MCRELEALRQSIVAYAKGFDVRALTGVQAGEVVKLCSAIKASVASIETLAAAVVAEGSSYRSEGYRSPEEQFARQSGMSPTQARRTLATGRRMLDQPEVAAAALAGKLSPEQAAAVSAGAEANPARTGDLLQMAGDISLAELNDAVARARAEATDLESRRRAIHARRTLSRFTDPEGVYHAYLSGNPEDGITIDQVLTAIRRQLTLRRRQEQIPSQKLSTLDYDAMTTLFDVARGRESEVTLDELLDLGLFPQFRRRPAPNPAPVAGAAAPVPPPAATTPGGDAASGSATGDDCGGGTEPGPGAGGDSSAGVGRPAVGTVTSDLFSTLEGPPDLVPSTGGAPPPGESGPPRKRLPGRPAHIIVRIDYDTLLRGYPLAGETCDIPGYGPIPVSLVHDLMDSGMGRLVACLTKNQRIQGVYLDRRHPNEYQKAALDFLYPVCAAQGCHTRAGMQADHREDWSRTHYTVIDLLDYLCWHHHALKTRKGWALVAGHGKRAFVPPDDPRHPRHHPPPTGTPSDPPADAASAVSGA